MTDGPCARVEQAIPGNQHLFKLQGHDVVELSPGTMGGTWSLHEGELTEQGKASHLDHLTKPVLVAFIKNSGISDKGLSGAAKAVLLEKCK